MQITKENKKTQMIQWAMFYWDLGFSVIPIKPIDKKPLIKWTNYQKELPTEEDIVRWFNQFPNANLAIVTGKLSGLLVVDLDTEDAINFFSQFFPGHKIPDYVPQVVTPKGGLHAYFRYPRDFESKKISLTGGSILHERLDLRGEGGYVVAPPSIIEGYHNEIYTWKNDISQEIPDIPQEFIKALRQFYNTQTNIKSGKSSGGKIIPMRKIIQTDKNYKIKYHHRDESLFHIANQLIKARTPIKEVEEILLAIAIHACNPPFTIKEAKTKVKSAINRHIEAPLRDPLENILIDNENCLTLKIVRKATESYNEILSNCILKPEGQIVDVRTQKIVGFKISKITKNKKTYTTIIPNHTATYYINEFGFSEKQARMMANIVSELFNRGNDLEGNEIPDIKSYSQIGWLNDEIFLHPSITNEKDYIWLHAEAYKDNILKATGDVEALKQLLELCSGSFAIIPILFSLFTLHDQENGIALEITGKTSKGKSIILRNASYLMGVKPDNWNATSNALIEQLSLYQNFPLFVDEIHEAKDEVVAQIIYQLLQQQGRKRLNRNGSFRDVKSFNTNLLTSGEYGIINIVERMRNVRPEGLLKRTISITSDNQRDLLGQDGEEVKDNMRILRKKAQGTLLKVWVENNRKSDFVFTRRGGAHYERALDAMHDINERLYQMGLISEDAKLDNAGIIEVLRTRQKDDEAIEVYDKNDYKDLIKQELHTNLYKMEDLLTKRRKPTEIIGWYKEYDDKIVYLVKRRPFKKMIADLQLDIKTVLKEPWVELKQVKIPSNNIPYRVYVLTFLRNK